jgi:hypothetical protein
LYAASHDDRPDFFAFEIPFAYTPSFVFVYWPITISSTNRMATTNCSTPSTCDFEI